MKRFLDLFKKTYSEWNSHDAPRMGASLAFYSVLSLAPLVILLVGICALAFGTAGAQAQLLEQFRAMVGPDGARAIQTVLNSAQKPTSGIVASAFGLITLLFGASGVFIELRATLDKLWEADTATTGTGIWAYIKDRFLSFGMVLAIGFLLLVSLAMSAAIGAAGKFVSNFGILPSAVWEVLNFIFSLAVVAGVFALILRYVPSIRLSWRDISFGASLTALLFTIGKTAIGIYLGKAGVGSAYGAAGSLVVLVVWVYYSAQIFFFGAMFTRVYAQAHGWQPRRVSQPSHAEAKPASNAPQAQPITQPVPQARPGAHLAPGNSPSAVAWLTAAGLVVAALFRKGSGTSKPARLQRN
jgi:membrane protein